MMKKYVYALVCGILLVCVMLTTACKPLDADEGGERDGDESVKTYNDTAWLDEIHDLGEVKTWDYSVQYVRAGVKSEPEHYPAVRIIRSVDEMKRYLAEEANVSDALTEACRKYDADYFKAQRLVIVLLEEGSGSIRHEVERLGTDGMRTFVEIKTIVPEVGTCDMAYWHILIEPEAGVYLDDESEVAVFLDGRNATDRPNTVTYGRRNASIAVTLKDGWAYDITDSADENEFSINIYPAGQSENKLRIAYYNGFGVCGTGLKQEQIMLGQYEAWMGTYDDNPVWNFITLRGLPGDYVILNEGGTKWWSEYGEEAMQILATLSVAQGQVTSSDAIRIARDKLNFDYDEVNTRYYADSGIWVVTLSRGGEEDRETMTVEVDIWGNICAMYDPTTIVYAEKPVIYLYPTEETEVRVKLDLDSALTCTYPAYRDGWTVTASPDGTLTDADGREYYCLYWEGETKAQYDLSKGFCVRGEDTAAFLEGALAKLGLSRREANEFIIYWLPQMERNAYNLIAFQQETYTDTAQLIIDPAPDSLLRVFMAWKPLTKAVEIAPQEFAPFARVGFTVVEWGGAQVK